MNYIKLGIVLISICILSGFGGNSDKEFFPFDEGRTWEYDFTVEGQSEQHRKIIVTGLSPIVTNNGKVMVREVRIKEVSNGNEETLFEYFMEDSKGIIINTSKNWVANPIITNLKYLVYLPIKVGSSTKWEDNIFSLESLVESINETVTVPAGTFKDCLKIKRNGINKKNGNAESGTHWHARNVGVVKSIFVRPNNKREVSQLVSYSYMDK